MLARLGKRAWLDCDGCRHSVMITPHELAPRFRLDMLSRPQGAIGSSLAMARRAPVLSGSERGSCGEGAPPATLRRPFLQCNYSFASALRACRSSAAHSLRTARASLLY
jgi:hypothetical protein